MIDGIMLVEPSEEHEARAMEYRQEHIDSGEARINGSGGFIRFDDYGEWLKHIRDAKSLDESSLKVPGTTYFSLIGDKLIGTIQLRHYLNAELERHGGHIGYAIRPSERGKGYGARQLALVLEKARERGIPKVMITCDKGNLASAKTAMKNGGVLTWEGYDPDEDEEIQIYWIDISN